MPKRYQNFPTPPIGGTIKLIFCTNWDPMAIQGSCCVASAFYQKKTQKALCYMRFYKNNSYFYYNLFNFVYCS